MPSTAMPVGNTSVGERDGTGQMRVEQLGPLAFSVSVSPLHCRLLLFPPNPPRPLGQETGLRARASNVLNRLSATELYSSTHAPCFVNATYTSVPHHTPKSTCRAPSDLSTRK